MIAAGVVTTEDVQELIAQYEKICEDALVKAKSETTLEFRHWLDSPWKGFFKDDQGKINCSRCLPVNCFKNRKIRLFSENVKNVFVE